MGRNNHLVVLSCSSLGSYTETRDKISSKEILKKKKKKKIKGCNAVSRFEILPGKYSVDSASRIFGNIR